MLIENSRMSEAGASKTPSGGYGLYMYSRVYRLTHCCIVVALSLGWNGNSTEAKFNSIGTYLFIDGKGKCVFLNLTKGVSNDKSKNLTKAIGK